MITAVGCYCVTLGALAGCVMAGRPNASGAAGATGINTGTFSALEGGATTGAVASIGAGTTGTGATAGTAVGTGSGVLTTSLDLTGMVLTTVCR
jgi:hypothetical protein